MAPELYAPELDAPPLRRYGLPELVYADSPAAGADFVSAIGGSFFARLVTVHCRLVTSADVADRELVLEYRNQADARFYVAGAPVEVTASTTIDYMFSAFLTEPAWPVDSTILVPLAPLLLLPTQEFALHIVAAEATDQISRVRYVREQFYTSGQPA